MRNSLNIRWRQWGNRRIPRSDSQLLSQKNIFILPTAAGVVYGLLLLIMLITAINYQNSLIYLLTFILGALFVGAMHQTHRNLSGLSVALVRPGEGQAGDDIPFILRLTAGKGSGFSLILSADGASVEGVHLSPGEFRDVVLAVPSVCRGYLRPDRIRVETRFPFGLLKAWSWLRPASAGVVFPRPLQAPDTIGAVNNGTEAASSVSIPGQDNADLRPWREGDMSQRVMWKRFARTGQMVVADWQGEQGSPQWLDFNAFPGVDTERRLSYLAWMVADRVQKNARFGLRLPGDTIEPDSGSLHGERCLRTLAVWGEQPPREPGSHPFGTRQSETVEAGVSV